VVEKFWESLAGQLADRWARVAPSALAFWLVVVAAWAWGHGGLHPLAARLKELGSYSSLTQGLLIVAALLVVAGSVAGVNSLATMIIPLLAGQWPGWARRLSARRTRAFLVKYQGLEAEWHELSDRVLAQDAEPVPADEWRLAELDGLLRRFPVPANRIMPTRFGNILRAAETQPEVRTGLVTSVVLPRLLLVIPRETRKELTSAWSAVNAVACVAVWSVLLIPASGWCPLALLAVAFGFAVSWRRLPARAETYADLLESVLDVYRPQLYARLRWPLPADPLTESACGRRLSEYLLRGTVDGAIRYRATGGGDDQ
jgi:hypothetical protein